MLTVGGGSFSSAAGCQRVRAVARRGGGCGSYRPCGGVDENMVMDRGASASAKALFYLHKRRGCDSHLKPLRLSFLPLTLTRRRRR